LQKGQLGRPSPAIGQESPVTSNKKDARLCRDGPWYAYPGPVPNIGPRHGRRATWVGASGDQTYLKIDESLINYLSLTRSTVMANKSSISKCCYIVKRFIFNLKNNNMIQNFLVFSNKIHYDPTYHGDV
jgi:hypothetical protein